MNNHESTASFTPDKETREASIDVESVEVKTENHNHSPQDTDLEERKKEQAQKDSEEIREIEKDLGINQNNLSLEDLDANAISPGVKNFLLKLGKEKTVQLLTSLNEKDIGVLKTWLALGPNDGMGDMALASLNTYRSRMEGLPVELINAAKESSDPEMQQRGLDAEQAFTEWTKGL
ncbi:hypothetical protein H7Y21_00710 [Arenimonas sp.]|nr:hypothetical protein [Candidatus Parcubacteria bacterium]